GTHVRLFLNQNIKLASAIGFRTVLQLFGSRYGFPLSVKLMTLGTNPGFWPGVDKNCAGAPKPGQERKNWPLPFSQLAVQHRRFLFFVLFR
ncbi:MAG: hypothetical protein QM296_00615, partial [Bacillota bacterium]|nr:hypothetical protein [Bacillota bacterium]